MNVPRVCYKGLGWTVNEPNSNIRKGSVDDHDNAEREYDALQHSFDHSQNMYQKPNELFKRNEDTLMREAEKTGSIIE